MTQPLHRTQVLLEPQQHRELTRIAAEEDRSLSDLLREIVRRDLERRRNDEERLKGQRRQAIEEVRQMRREMLAQMPPGGPRLDVEEMIRQSREERADEIWEAVRGRSDRS